MEIKAAEISVRISVRGIENMDMHQIYELWRKESTKAWREVRKQLKKIKDVSR